MSLLCSLAKIIKFYKKISFFPYLNENLIIPTIKWFALTVIGGA